MFAIVVFGEVSVLWSMAALGPGRARRRPAARRDPRWHSLPTAYGVSISTAKANTDAWPRGEVTGLTLTLREVL